MNSSYYKFRTLTNLFLSFLFTTLAAPNANAQVEYQDVKEFNTLYSFENIAFEWKGAATVQVLLNEGINDLNEKKLALAIGNFDSLLKTKPNFDVALYYRGICYRLQNDLIKAKADFTKLIELNDHLPQAYLEMSKVKVQAGFNNEATQFLTTCIQKFPTYVSAYYLMGENYLRTKEVEKAKSYFDTCQKIAPAFPAAKAKLGLIEIAIKKDAQAGLKFFDEGIQQDSLQKEALWCRATICYRLEPKKSIRDLNTLVRHNATNFYFSFQRGLTLLALGNIDGAWSDFKIISTDQARAVTNNSAAIEKLITIQNLRNYQAKVIYGLNEKDQYTYKKGFCLIVAEKYQEAINILSHAKSKKNASWHYLLGIANQNIRLLEESQTHFVSALSLDNDILDVHKFRGIYLLGTNDIPKSIKHFDEMIRLSPGDKSGYEARSIANLRLKNYKLAIGDAGKVLEIDYFDCTARKVLGASYLAQDKILPAFEAMVPCHDSEIHKLDLVKFHDSITELLKAGDTTKVMYYLNKMTDIVPLYEAGTRLKIDILSSQNKLVELQSFLKERVQRLAKLNSKEYGDYINKELAHVEYILKEKK